MALKEKKFNYQELSVPSLIGLTSLRLEAIADRLIFKPLKLTSASFRILAVIGELGEIAPKEILSYLGGTKSNLTQRLNYLSRLSLVKIKKSDSGDRRQIKISLTKQGQASLSKIKASIDHNQLHLEKFFTALELKSFLSFIIKLNKKLDACGGHSMEICKNKSCQI